MSKKNKSNGGTLFNNQILKPDDFLTNPTNSTRYFGYISGMKGYEDGYIVLKWGSHRSYHKGFGCYHIWQQHGTESKLKKLCNSIEDVPNLVSQILTPGSRILDTGKDRPTVIKNNLGTLILDCPNYQRDYYSVVTVFFDTNIRGTVIGSVKRLPETETK